jgi:hypothetical protein
MQIERASTMKITATAHKGRALVLRHTTGTARGAVVRLATASVLAGIAAGATGGTAAAAPGAPLPTFTGSTSLQGLLLTEREVGTIVGARKLHEVRSGNRLGNTDVQPSSCVSAYAPFQAAAYADTDPQDVAFTVIADRDIKNLMVSQAVVQLSGKAIRHMEATADAWADCKGETVTTSDGQSWVMDAPRVNDDRTIVTLAQTSADGTATCERAIAAYRDIFIDVMSCSTGRAEGQAAKVTQEIADKANSQPT